MKMFFPAKVNPQLIISTKFWSSLMEQNNAFTKVLMIYFIVLTCGACTQKTTPHFTSISPAQSGVDFSNNLKYTEDYNPYTYRNFYNGGGVALGDINNDGLLDI